jgi:hypothetical protein
MKACPEDRLSWRDEIDTALQAWIEALGGSRGAQGWRRVGTARPTEQPGSYTVDIRGAELTADQVDSLRLAGPEEESVRRGLPVMVAEADGELLRVRVAEFAAPAQLYLWRLKQQPTFLITALRDRLGDLTDAGFAGRLARGELGGIPAPVTSPSLLAAQADAYRACLGSGLWLVWGPPGTGKTRVLQAAISDLITKGKRVLLVSGTNIAVDNALLGVVRARRHQLGDIVRVGPPQLREIADDPQVCLQLMMQTRLSQVEERRRNVAMALLEMNRRHERQSDLESRLAGFDLAAHESAVTLLAQPGHTVAQTSSAVAECELTAGQDQRAIEDARTERDKAAALAAAAEPDRALWATVEEEEADLALVEEAARRAEARALVAHNACASIEEEIAVLRQPSGKVRLRDRGALRTVERRLDAKRPERDQLRADALSARRTADSFRQDAERRIATLAAQTRISRDELRDRETIASEAQRLLTQLELAQSAMLDQLTRLRDDLVAARNAEELVAACARRGWPEMYAQLEVARREVTQDNERRPALEAQHTELHEEYGRLARDAQGEIIKAARLVATTLARFRTTKAVVDGKYDVVLIDEVGAATLPEVLLAVSKASECSVLLGDFMQLGPVLPSALDAKDRADIRRWLMTDVFRHCGISTPAQALQHESCLVLDTQHRFGPHIMQLANLLAYDDVLKAGAGVRSHAEDDPEIVLIDTDGLGDLAQVHRIRRNSGWWAAGLLLARALVELHTENGESTGVITPYAYQAQATLEALRDVEADGRPSLKLALHTASKDGSSPSSFSTLSNPSTMAASG